MKQPPHDDLPPPDQKHPEGELPPNQSLMRTAPNLPVDGRLQGSAGIVPFDAFMGVDGEQLEQFLTLIRDYYDKVDKATFFMELKTEEMNVSGIRNVRGILSHLVMFLDPNTTTEKRKEQMVNAEGHIRRAISEPYEMALDGLTVKFSQTYERYKKEVLPVREQYASLRKGPETGNIEVKLREIQRLGIRGKELKEKDLRNPEWEYGVSCFIEAFEKLSSLNSQLEEYCNAIDSMHELEAREQALRAQLREEIHQDFAKESQHSTHLHYFGFAIGILGIIIAVLLVLLPTIGEWIRRFLHLTP